MSFRQKCVLVIYMLYARYIYAEFCVYHSFVNIYKICVIYSMYDIMYIYVYMDIYSCICGYMYVYVVLNFRYICVLWGLFISIPLTCSCSHCPVLFSLQHDILLHEHTTISYLCYEHLDCLAFIFIIHKKGGKKFYLTDFCNLFERMSPCSTQRYKTLAHPSLDSGRKQRYGLKSCEWTKFPQRKVYWEGGRG